MDIWNSSDTSICTLTPDDCRMEEVRLSFEIKTAETLESSLNDIDKESAALTEDKIVNASKMGNPNKSDDKTLDNILNASSKDIFIES